MMVDPMFIIILFYFFINKDCFTAVTCTCVLVYLYTSTQLNKYTSTQVWTGDFGSKLLN